MKTKSILAIQWMWLLCFIALAGVGLGQSKGAKGLPGFDLPRFGSGDQLPCEFSASYDVERDSNRGTLRVTASPEDGFHIYSVTQPKDGPTRTTIKPKGDAFKIIGDFEPDAQPHVSLNEPAFDGIPVESHMQPVTWTATIEFAKPPSEKPEAIQVSVSGLVCTNGDGQCIPVRDMIVQAEFATFYESAKATAKDAITTLREPDSKSEWKVSLSKSKVKAGDTLDIVITGKPDATFSLYKNDPFDSETRNRTLLVLKQKGGLKAGAPSANKPLKSKTLAGDKIDYYEGEVEFRIPLKVGTEIVPNTYPIVGLVGYQACNEESCDQPRGLEWRAELEISDSASSDSPSTAVLRPVTYESIAKLPNRSGWISEDRKIALTLSFSELLGKFCLAMLGGLILNVMPCVLPVIGLKIMGFVSEAAGDRKTAATLTLVYAAGIIALILGLGILSVAVRAWTGEAYGWGQQFGSLTFRIVTTSFMFALALSFLGVWEIPIPGFAMSKTSTELSNREGYVGAFSKGLITTILATPCSAPFLGGVFLVALTQPAWVVLLIFSGVGLGMALPYLLLAAQPSLLSFIPKPGPWMETFKEFLAFPMLLAVVMFVNGFSGDDKMAMLAALIFVWFACWMVGRVPIWAESSVRARSWLFAWTIATLGVLGSFYFMQPSPYRLSWRAYNEDALEQAVREGKTVLIDFTAEWCQNCKFNLNTAIHTKRVKEIVEKNQVVAMEADMTDYPAHIKEKLIELDSISIPVLAIYKPGDTENPIVLRDVLSESDVVKALQEAGPSSTSAAKPTSFQNDKDNSVKDPKS
jgi:suppressor for copper-sensitivity B